MCIFQEKFLEKSMASDCVTFSIHVHANWKYVFTSSNCTGRVPSVNSFIIKCMLLKLQQTLHLIARINANATLVFIPPPPQRKRILNYKILIHALILHHRPFDYCFRVVLWTLKKWNNLLNATNEGVINNKIYNFRIVLTRKNY